MRAPWLATDGGEVARVVLVDDHGILREGLARALEQEKDLRVVGVWSEAEKALRYLESERFDVAVLDYHLPGMDGITATRRMLEVHPEIRAVILSMHCQEALVVEAFEAGVAAFLPKESSVTELVEAIRQVRQGETVLSPKITRQILDFCRRSRNRDGEPEVLTEVQVQILRMAACGYANKEIADRLGMPLNTVKLRLKEIFARLDARDRTHAVILALRLGLFGLDDTES